MGRHHQTSPKHKEESKMVKEIEFTYKEISNCPDVAMIRFYIKFTLQANGFNFNKPIIRIDDTKNFKIIYKQ